MFSWASTTDTAVHLSRGAVVRLLKNGVLRIEGTLPDWVSKPPDSDMLPAYHPITHQPARPTTSRFEPIMLDIPSEPIPPAPPCPDHSGGRFRAITR